MIGFFSFVINDYYHYYILSGYGVNKLGFYRYKLKYRLVKVLETLEEMIKELSPELKQEVYDFTQFLLTKNVPRKHKKMQLKWAGGLREFREQYTSLELQKKSLEWWGN